MTAAAYVGVVHAGFVWDDRGLVQGNPRLASLSNIPSYFLGDLWEGVTEGGSGYYRPMFLTWLALVRAVAGESAVAWHLGGLMWHLGAIVALHALLLRLVPPRGALTGAAIFALHPVQSEAVAWISAHNDTMAAALALASLVLAAPERPGLPRLGAAAGLAAMAVLSKESALLCPLMLVALDRGRGLAGAWLRPVALAVGVALALSLRALSGVGTAALPSAVGLNVVWAQAHELALTVGALLVVPWPLSAARSIEWMDLDPLRSLAAVGLGLGLAVAAIRDGPWRAPVRVGIAWFCLGFAPAVLAIASRGLLGERYLYLPMAGVALAGAGLLGAARPRLLIAPALAALVLLSLRLPDWASRFSVWEAALQDLPDPYVHFGYAEALREHGDARGALEHYRMALQGQPLERQACVPAIELTLASAQPAAALALAAEVAPRGCGSDPEFQGLYAVTRCFAGDWEGARALIDAMNAPDPKKRDVVVRAALARLDGREQVYGEMVDAWSGAVPLDVQVGRLLRAGGHAELAP